MKIYTVSAETEPWGSIFQNGFSGEVELIIGPKKVRFYQNLSIFTALEQTKSSKTHYGNEGGGLFKSGALFAPIR